MGISPGLDAIFYVYVYFDLDGAPLYVGKGYGERWLRIDTGSGRNPHFIRTAKKATQAGRELPRIKVRENLSEEQAFQIERALIGAIGRRIDGTGPLLNLTLGGEGIHGFAHSEETKAKIAVAATKRGHHSPEHIAKIIASSAGRPKPRGFGEAVALRQLGRKLSQETKDKIAAKATGRKYAPRRAMTEAEKENLRIKNTGKRASPEARAKMSAAHTERWQRIKWASLQV